MPAGAGCGLEGIGIFGGPAGRGIGAGRAVCGGTIVVSSFVCGRDGIVGCGVSTIVVRAFASGGSTVSPNCGPRFTPEGTPSGKRFRLPGKGMSVLRSKSHGDMYVQVSVETPQKLTKRQKELLAEFEKESSKETHPESNGFFAKMREFFE